MPRVLKIFEEFKNGEYVHLEDLKSMNDHICGNLNNWTSNYRFRYNMYSYSSKAYIVCRWRQSKGLPLIAKWGEAVCGKDLVDFFSKIFPRSGLFLNHKITAEAGVIDSGYQEIVHVLLFNHSDEVFSIKIGDRIAQVVFLEQFDVKFEMVQSTDLLPKSVRNEGGFGSTEI